MARTRGLIVRVPPDEVVARAMSLCVVPDDPAARIYYLVGAGGKDPEALTCATRAKDTKRLVSDCVGLASWAMGWDRYQPERATSYEGWMNQHSALEETNRPGGLFRRLAVPVMGCMATMDNYVNDLGKKRVGHVGIVVSVSPLTIVHCSPSNERRVGQSIAATSRVVAFGGHPVFWLVLSPWVVADRELPVAIVGPPEGLVVG